MNLSIISILTSFTRLMDIFHILLFGNTARILPASGTTKSIQQFPEICKNVICDRSMQEVELKVELSEKDFLFLKERLPQMAQFVGVVEIEDYYLDHPHASFVSLASDGFKSASQYLRVRNCSSGHSLCFKKVIRDSQGENPYCLEYEVVIDRPETTLQLFYQMGYKDSAIIKKRRTLFIFKDYEIALDEVADLGLFVEIELKKQVDDPIKGLKELEVFLKETLKVTEYTKRTDGYVSMLWNGRSKCCC